MISETLLDKHQIINSFQDLPERVTADALIERILFIQLIEERIVSANQGNVVPHDQVLKELKELKARKIAEREALQA